MSLPSDNLLQPDAYTAGTRERRRGVMIPYVRAEVWLDQVARTMWPGAFRTKDDARKFMGCQTGGWTEFLKVPVSDWPELRRLAAI